MMKKIIFQCIMVAILLSLVSCGVSETVYFYNTEHEPYTTSEPILPQEISAEAEEVVVEEIPVADVGETALPHPFATALKAYMEGYDGVVRAYLATLDEYGTMGVLTARPNRVGGGYGPGTLFYMQDGDLFQTDVSLGNLFVAGTYNRLMERFYSHTHVLEFIYKLEFGKLEISTRLEYFSDEYLSYLFDDYDVVAELIAERDALAEYAREKYGLVALLPPSFGHKQNTEDQTAQILAMTINCVPSLTCVR